MASNTEFSKDITSGIEGITNEDKIIYNFLSEKIKQTTDFFYKINRKSSLIEYDYFKSFLWDVLNDIYSKTSDINARDLIKFQSFFRGNLYNLCNESLVFSRALAKPYGYPGDYVMLQTLYDNKPVSRTRLGKFLDQFFFDDELAKAVVNRVEVMGDRVINFIKDSNQKEINILNIASGSGFEFRKIIDQKYDKKVTFHCFDQEVASLLYIKQNFVGRNKNIDIKLYKEDIKLFFRNWKNEQKFDLIYNIGLADYLPDLVLLSLTKESLMNLTKNGVFVLAHKDYLKFPYHHPSWLYNWNFIHRSLEDYKKLIKDSDIKNKFSIWFESQKKVIYFSEYNEQIHKESSKLSL